MSIEVHCPNPDCARVHLVKSHYAGMRGRCPACQAWMYVPAGAVGSRVGGEKSLPDWAADEPVAAAPKKRPAALEESPSPRKRPAAVEEEPFEQAPSRRSRKAKLEREAADEAVEAVREGAEPAARPRRRFSWMGAVFLLLGSLGMGAVAAAPHLATPTIQATGEFVPHYSNHKTESIDSEFGLFTSLLPGIVAGLTFLFFLGGVIARRLGFVTLFILYLATIFAAIALLMALYKFKEERDYATRFVGHIESSKKAGTQGEATRSINQQVYAATAGTALACASYLLAALFIHRRWWARVVTFLLLGVVVAFGPVYQYRMDLGLGDVLPELNLSDLLKVISF